MNWFEIKANCITPDFKLIDFNNNSDVDLKSGKSTEIQIDEKNSAKKYKVFNMTNATLFLKFSARNVQLSQEKLLLRANQSKVISISPKTDYNCSDSISINEFLKWNVYFRNNFPIKFDALRFKIIPNNYKKSSRCFESVQASIYMNGYSSHTCYELIFIDHPFIKVNDKKTIKTNSNVEFELSFTPSVLNKLKGNIKANNGQIEVNYQINYEVAELITEPNNLINFGLTKLNEKKKSKFRIKNTGEREMELTIVKKPPKSSGSTVISIKELKSYSEIDLRENQSIKINPSKDVTYEIELASNTTGFFLQNLILSTNDAFYIDDYGNFETVNKCITIFAYITNDDQNIKPLSIDLNQLQKLFDQFLRLEINNFTKLSYPSILIASISNGLHFDKLPNNKDDFLILLGKNVDEELKKKSR